MKYKGTAYSAPSHYIWLSIRPLGTNFSEIVIEMKKIFIHENASENIVCEMAAILSRESLVKALTNMDVMIRVLDDIALEPL